MIEVLPIREKEKIKEYFDKYNFVFCETSGVVTAKDREEILGFCLYDLTDKKMTIKKIEPVNDIMLSDGIIRSTLHVGTENFVLDAFYESAEYDELFARLDFIKDKEKRQLNTDKLFGGCHCGK